MKLSYKRDMTHNYMIPESEDPLSGQDYQIHMLMENHLEGLLPCSIKRMDGQSRYFYDITSRQSMESVYEKDSLREKELRTLLRGLYRALLEVKRFLLDAGKVVLEPEMIYMDIETKEPLFAYLPSYQGDILSSFQNFASRLLQMLDQSDTNAVLLGYEVYRKSMEINYSLENLLKEVAYGEISETRESKKEQPVLIEEKVCVNVIPPPQSCPTPTPQKEERSVKKEERKTEPIPWKKVILITLLVLGISTGIVFAAWFFEWNVTQLGGVAFFTASLLAWGISAVSDEKKKKSQSARMHKKEQKADQRSKKKIKKMESVPQRVETPARAESPRKQEAIQKLEPVGATVLLSDGEEEYVPHLSLISMNPRERNSVVLLNEVYTIGKLRNKTDICIDHPSISRLHARIRKEGKEYYLYDLNSTNGTYVNGERLGVNERVQIQLSDEIRFADLGYYVGKC